MILLKPDYVSCLDSAMHMARTVFVQNDYRGLVGTFLIKRTLQPELSVHIQGPFPPPVRVHVFLAGCVCTQIPGSADENNMEP